MTKLAVAFSALLLVSPASVAQATHQSTTTFVLASDSGRTGQQIVKVVASVHAGNSPSQRNK